MDGTAGTVGAIGDGLADVLLVESRTGTAESGVGALLSVDCVPNNQGVAITTTAVRTSARRNRLSIVLKHDHGTGS